MQFLEEEYQTIKEENIQGRYITNEQLKSFLGNLSDKLVDLSSGTSVLNKTIHILSLGKGTIKVLMWSQMHGNESTTTKAVIDLINFLGAGSPLAKKLLKQCTFKLIPILNPDGAAAYTRTNANEIDLNRDARDLSQPESILLRKLFDDFEPDYCFNLHDQRTIFNVGETEKPATLSFLAPAADEARTTTPSRATSMQLIVQMNALLRTRISGQLGRYDDTFNHNCVGDAFQMLETPTVLVEAGHAAGDYLREKTRMYVFFALLAALSGIVDNSIKDQNIADYLEIPENNKLFLDVLIHNAHRISTSYKEGESVGLLYREVLKNGLIHFEPYVEKTGNLNRYFGHQILDCDKVSDLELLKADSAMYRLLI